MSIARLIHLLAHHPDFSTSTDDLTHFSRYIDFFIECCVSSTNISLIFHIVTRLKTVCDIEPMNDRSENIYILSDLAQLIIRDRSSAQQWALTTYPGPLSLPHDLFRRLSTTMIAETLRKNHLPRDYVQSRRAPHRSAMGTPAKRTVDHTNQQRADSEMSPRTGKTTEKRRRMLDAEAKPLRRNAPRAARASNKANTMADDDDDDDDDASDMDAHHHRMEIS
ncbi:hypothetical protein SYNPS1DRAFT_31415 [Syncephalis pseudoplumigaleata]|uniref:Uncharacterized protein n=1 Tax=Syncephalis pseudoplumigaleata TaxID=1712513 RepID=A0A4P9YUM7_9FUNG|nr:hypothetical protein SYNPS1DRAFT_31415 [Syncephalis pseudoplumigaleata]|eukprot:RKP22911.1 hypothetical protein SYNPS1DRAFT_31415 [Syncephalis pseudoplumigaleata]